MARYFGTVETIETTHVSGWVLDADAPTKPVWIEVETPSGHVIRTRASRPRGDTNVAGMGTGPVGFFVPLHEIDREGPGDIRVRVADTDQVLGIGADLTTAERLSRARFQVSSRFGTKSSEANQPIFATIGKIEGGHIEVWVDSEDEELSLMVTVGNIPAWQAPEVTELPDLSEKARAFHFFISGLTEGAEIGLWTISAERIELCETRRVSRTLFERSIFKQFARAVEIARQPGAVAVTCWDGGHNPIGRAKVLYDVLAGRRPVVLFAFLFSDFGGDIWPPLTTSDAAIVTIPWSERHFFLRIARQMGLVFDTVWMCKPRMPTFELSSALAKPDAALILDIDDNEDEFSTSKGSRTKAYGRTSIGLSRFTMENVPARTVASVSLQEDFGGHMVRHARTQQNIEPLAKSPTLKVGFIGTVRPHKRIVEAAQAINELNAAAGTQPFEFHVYGDVQPAAVRNALLEEGAVLKDNIPLHALSDHLASFHLILTGFPPETQEETPITRHQISAKIGDAMSVGRPALVPSGASVADLAETNGIFLFTADTFAAQLEAAAEKVGETVTLPRDFTLDGAYEAFNAAEEEARGAQRASEALALMPAPLKTPDSQPTLVLLWKQHDAGLYGRRPDILARSYASAYPDHRVIMLEMLYPDFDHRYRSDNSGLSEAAFLRELNTRKSKGVVQNGVEYVQLRIERSDQMNRTLMEYFGANAILPTNAVLVLFPNILHLQRVYDVLSPYPIVADIVDNQLAWSTDGQKAAVIQQYFSLSRISNCMVFNSARNLETFRETGILSGVDQKVSHIPNWYQLPADFETPAQKASGKHINIFYTGNMNDRIDWALLGDIADLDDRIRLHLVGEASRSFDSLVELLESRPNTIFHGVKNERMSLEMLAQADLTVMPHLVDDVSKYMNPLKVHMYGALGLSTVASDIPGIVASDLLTIASSREDFLAKVKALIGTTTRKPVRASEGLGQDYLDLITRLRGSV
ncbi:MAG: glycosyltransferase [Rhodobacteraceae bacterium]|nr:glycosyltransferase [Paracoccaceae bacterium]